jgi:hypothetical protein
MGKYEEGDLSNLCEPGKITPVASQDYPGGSVKIGINGSSVNSGIVTNSSVLNFNERVFLGEGGVIDIEKCRKLNVNFDFYFNSGSTYKVGLNQQLICLISA